MTETYFRGRLFGPGLPGAGVGASGQWRGETLRLTAGARELSIGLDDLHLEAAGFNDVRLRVSWRGNDGLYAFFLEEQADRDTFAAAGPSGVHSKLAGVRIRSRRLERRLRLGWAVLLLFLSLPVLGLVAFIWQADALAGWVADKVPHEQEARLGELTLTQLRAQMRLIESGPAVEVLAAIGDRLTAGSRHSYRWLVADRPEINALAAPGGVVVVFAGLMREVDSAEELAGVLAHETAHVELRHSLRGAIKGFGVRALLSLATGDVAGPLAQDLAARLTEMKFSRAAESEADQRGLVMLVEAGISPHGMQRFFERLARRESAGQGWTLFSTHPASAERLTALGRQIETLPARPYAPLAIDWPTIRASLAGSR